MFTLKNYTIKGVVILAGIRWHFGRHAMLVITANNAKSTLFCIIWNFATNDIMAPYGDSASVIRMMHVT